MKIGIITIHFGINYGSALQAYSLSNYIRNMGEEVELINYIPERYSIKRRYFYTSEKNNFLIKCGYLVAVAPSKFIYNHIFNRFLRLYTPLGKKINKYKKLKEEYDKYDLLITGSDQVWNSDYNEGLDRAYFLEFAGKKTKKISYAASCGKTEFSFAELKKMKEYLDTFIGISVREEQALELLYNMGIDNVTHVLDPIFLFNRKEWEKCIKKRTISENYLFMYILDGDDKETVDIGVKIAKSLGLKTVLISYGHVWSGDNRVDYYLIQKSPLDFIELMMHADYIVTNSFHGVAFSINFNKQFVAFRRKHYNSRIDSIVKMVGLSERLIDINNDKKIVEMMTKRIEYAVVNPKLEKYRDKSKTFLKDMLNRTKRKDDKKI